MPSTEGLRIENGMVIGGVSIGIAESTFAVCTIEEYESMSEEEASELLNDVAFGDGKVEIYFKSDE